MANGEGRVPLLCEQCGILGFDGWPMALAVGDTIPGTNSSPPPLKRWATHQRWITHPRMERLIRYSAFDIHHSS